MGDGAGLTGSAMNASKQAALGSNMAWRRSGPAAIEQKMCLPISRSAIEPSEGQRPRRAGIGQSLSGKSRLKGMRS